MVKAKSKARRKTAAVRPSADLTPNAVISSLVCALPLIVVGGLQSVLNRPGNEATFMAMLFLYVQGICLAFFWRRIQSEFKLFIGYLYVFVLWVCILLQASAAIHQLPPQYISIVTLGSAVIIGLLLCLVWLGHSIHNPSTLAIFTLAGLTLFLSNMSGDSWTISLPNFSEEDLTISDNSDDGIIRADDPELNKNTRTMERPDFLPPRPEKAENSPPPATKKAPPPRPKIIKWSYSGESGPKSWSSLDRSFSLCGLGKEQSPVDVSSSWEVRDHLRHFNKPMAFQVVNDGHAIKVNFRYGNQIYVNKQAFEIKQMVLRSPSEHLYEGKAFPMELQFMQKSRKGEISYIGLFVEEGKENNEMNKVLNTMPKSKDNTPAKKPSWINLKKIFPAKLHSFSYKGSLTEPPCTEGVSWNILNNPIELSKDQIRKFRALYKHNSRPTQAFNNRE